MTSFPRNMLSSHPVWLQSERARAICIVANSSLSRLSYSHVLWLGIVWTYEIVYWALDDHHCVDDRAVYCCIRWLIIAVRCFDAAYCSAVGDGGRSTLLGFCWLVNPVGGMHSMTGQMRYTTGGTGVWSTDVWCTNRSLFMYVCFEVNCQRCQ